MNADPCFCVREWLQREKQMEDLVSEGDCSSTKIVMKSELARKLRFEDIISDINKNVHARSNKYNDMDESCCTDRMLKVNSSTLFYSCTDNPKTPINLLQNIYESILVNTDFAFKDIQSVKFDFPIKCTCNTQGRAGKREQSKEEVEHLFVNKFPISETKSSCRCKSEISETLTKSLYTSASSFDIPNRKAECSKNYCRLQQRKGVNKCSSAPTCNTSTGSESKYIEPKQESVRTENQLKEQKSLKVKFERNKEIIKCDCKCCKEDENDQEKKLRSDKKLCMMEEISEKDKTQQKKEISLPLAKEYNVPSKLENISKQYKNEEKTPCVSCNREICITTESCWMCDTAQQKAECDSTACKNCNEYICVTMESCGLCNMMKQNTDCNLSTCKDCDEDICVATDTCGMCNMEQEQQNIDCNSTACENCNKEVCTTTETCGMCTMQQKTCKSCNREFLIPDTECFCKNMESILEKIKNLIREYMPKCNCELQSNRNNCKPLQNFYSQSNLQSKHFETVDNVRRCCLSNNSVEVPCEYQAKLECCGGNIPRVMKSSETCNEKLDNLIKIIGDNFPDCTCPSSQKCDQSVLDNTLFVKGGDGNDVPGTNVDTKVYESDIGEILNVNEIGLMEIKELTETSIMVKYAIPQYEGIQGYKLYVNDIFIHNLCCATSTLAIIKDLPAVAKIYKIVCIKK